MIDLLVGCVRIGVGHRHGVVALDLQSTIPLLRTSQPSGNAAECDPHVATDGETIDGFAVATGHRDGDPDRFARFQGREIRIVDADEEALPRFNLGQLLVLGRHVRANLLQRRDRPAVMTQLEMAQADVVVGLIDLSTDGEMLDHVSHHAETLAEIAGLIKTDTNLQRRFGPLLLVPVLLAGNRLEMDSRTVVRPIAFQEEIAQPHVSLVSQPAAWVSLDHTLPDLDGLLEFSGLDPRITRLDQLLRRPILDQRSSRSLRLR